ncbi:MAG: ABC transporter ATP-binding protein [Desulfovibrio sp.]|jgi:multiple sugar transport system ATP-binding protein|nr:ABC transporter ATP-binding protein [Desulfovibrio sp.]
MKVPKLELVDLRKEYAGGDVVAVDGINLSVDPGETLALLGPSGCGKSTALNMIVGLEQPTGGDIRVDGASVVAMPAGQRNIGLVFQDYAVFTSMTVRQNLAFGLKIRNMDRNSVNREVEKTAELLGMKDRLEAKASTLGGSELQRVAIGRTLVTKPSLLLLDEPLSNLEAPARLAMRQELRRLQQEIALTVVYVTHDQVEALSLADHIAVMSYGKIIQVEKTARIVEAPGHAGVAAFLGSPPMNILRGRINVENGRVRFTGYNLTFLLPACSIPDCCAAAQAGVMLSLGFRAEDLSLAGAGDGLAAGRVLDIEARGMDSIVSVDVRGTIMKSIVLSTSSVHEGETVGLTVAPDDIHIFDGWTGLRINERFHGNG